MYGVTVASGFNQSEDYSVTFNTNQEKRSNWGTVKEPTYITCHSTGKLERDILNLITNNHWTKPKKNKLIFLPLQIAVGKKS